MDNSLISGNHRSGFFCLQKIVFRYFKEFCVLPAFVAFCSPMVNLADRRCNWFPRKDKDNLSIALSSNLSVVKNLTFFFKSTLSASDKLLFEKTNSGNFVGSFHY